MLGRGFASDRFGSRDTARPGGGPVQMEETRPDETEDDGWAVGKEKLAGILWLAEAVTPSKLARKEIMHIVGLA